MSATAQIARLRQQLAARFPGATRALGRTFATDLPFFDESTGGGLPLSAVTEIVASAPSCGVTLFWQQLFAVSRAAQKRVALVDALDEFDPASFPADLLVHLVWARCRSVTEALAATDLLARDANLGLVLLDLRHAPFRDLRRVPSTSWYRLQRAVEPTDTTLVIATPTACVPSAQLRLELPHSFSADAFMRERPSLAAELSPVVRRQRFHAAVG